MRYMPIEILPSFLDELFKNFKDLPRPVQFLLNFLLENRDRTQDGALHTVHDKGAPTKSKS